ncbi:MAG: M48 family metalloprotease [Thermoproteota archaeon]|jgi:heat shock protein HtpX|nr:M48 family metalloprotease [Thermoproteota archaeon]
MAYALKIYVKTVLLMALLGAILIGIGYLIGGIAVAFAFLIMSLILNIIFYFISDKLVLYSAGARIVSEAEAPRLHRIVERVAAKAGIKKPKVAIVNAPQPNAFATGRGPGHAVVAATTGLLTIMNDDELEAVFGHEIGHVVNRDVLVATIAAAIASAITWLAYFLFLVVLARGRNGGEVALALATYILAPFTASLIQLAISRAREYLADYTSAKLTGKPQDLISALTKIENYIMSGARLDAPQTTASLWIANPFRKGITAEDVIEWFSTHPSTKKRIERLKQIAKEMGIYIM